MSLTEERTRIERAVNPTLEVHHYCMVCSPRAERALCGARLHGIDLGGTAVTCAVCDKMRQCLGCGGIR